MTTEAWTIIGTGITLAILNVGLFAWLRADVKDLRNNMHSLEVELRERMAKLEGLLEGLREAISGRRNAA